ncbi:MAG: hypothetical protein K0B00_07295 [Rhodobacteraceae bacterium]|nr:hypothetical protein [Paracoccaceae bacterium]
MRYALLAMVLVAACASPAPEFFGATRHEITLDGIRFVVLHKGNAAEVIRMGYLARADRAAVPALMLRAVEQTTGCRVLPGSIVTGLPGDTGEARMRLACPTPAA